jgi:hypothetical protein
MESRIDKSGFFREKTGVDQETCSRNQKETGQYHESKDSIFIILVFNERVMKRSVLLSETKKNRKMITYGLFYCSFRSCSLKNISKTGTIRF